MDIEQQGARRVAGVRCMHCAATQTPQQKTIDSAKCQFSGLCSLAGTGNIIEYPGELGRGKIRVESQPGLACYRRLMTVVF